MVKLTHGQDQLVYALSLLRSDAQLWYTQLTCYEADSAPQDWDDLKEQLRKEFVPINAVIQARDKLAVLTQKDSVANYINDFRRLKLQIRDLSQGDALDRFVRGLVKHIRVAVRSRFPSTLSEAESLALAIEAAALDDEAVIPVTTQAAQQAVQSTPNYDPMDLDSLRTVVNALADQVNSQYRDNRGRFTSGNRGNYNKARGGYSNYGSGSSGNGPRCYSCGGIGHMKRECPTHRNRVQGRGATRGGYNGSLKG